MGEAELDWVVVAIFRLLISTHLDPRQVKDSLAMSTQTHQQIKNR